MEENNNICIHVLIPELKNAGITLQQIHDELDYREMAGVIDGQCGWDDDLIIYSTTELEAAEIFWSACEDTRKCSQD